MKRVKIILTIIVSVYIGYYSLRSYRIGTQKWKFSDHTPILGDMTELDLSIIGLFNDEIYIGGIAVARLVDYQYRIMDDVIIIESIDKKYKGRYCSK